MSWVSAVLALIKALPWFQKKFDELMAAYLELKIKEHDAEFAKALKELMEKNNQIPLEEAIGSDNAGKPAIRREGIHERHRTNPTDPST